MGCLSLKYIFLEFLFNLFFFVIWMSFYSRDWEKEVGQNPLKSLLFHFQNRHPYSLFQIPLKDTDSDLPSMKYFFLTQHFYPPCCITHLSALWGNCSQCANPQVSLQRRMIRFYLRLSSVWTERQMAGCKVVFICLPTHYTESHLY